MADTRVAQARLPSARGRGASGRVAVARGRGAAMPAALLHHSFAQLGATSARLPANARLTLARARPNARGGRNAAAAARQPRAAAVPLGRSAAGRVAPSAAGRGGSLTSAAGRRRTSASGVLRGGREAKKQAIGVVRGGRVAAAGLVRGGRVGGGVRAGRVGGAISKAGSRKVSAGGGRRGGAALKLVKKPVRTGQTVRGGASRVALMGGAAALGVRPRAAPRGPAVRAVAPAAKTSQEEDLDGDLLAYRAEACDDDAADALDMDL